MDNGRSKIMMDGLKMMMGGKKMMMMDGSKMTMSGAKMMMAKQWPSMRQRPNLGAWRSVQLASGVWWSVQFKSNLFVCGTPQGTHSHACISAS